ncbi:MAG: tetratricopeptide repeat protein, partial [Deltaproteobacteria bacterium]|nr:tetratricopeptide repeat protein [Deltaproteobacteria bacterium]
NLLARIALKKNELREAERFAELALSATSDVGLELEQANSLRILGITKSRTGQWDKAEKFLQEALVLDKQEAEPLKIAADLEALAELSALKKEPARQQEYLQRAKVVRENSKLLKNN